MTTRRIILVLAGGALLFAIATAAVAVSLFFTIGSLDTPRTNLMVLFLAVSVLLVLAALIVRRQEKSHL